MAFNFDKYANTGKQFMHELTEELGYANEPERAARVLKSVLHTLRDHLTIEESLQLLAQLPMFLKAVYVDGWSGKQHKKIKHLNDFLSEIHQHDGFPAADDFGDGKETLALTVMVFLMLRKYVSEGEM
ncbi:MAG TPA: DUF2267 domain-containing protein, partial [Bacteroidia bacterium]|nr:DUF2267 domain-containing protein [Bacteroidia bacterium]